MRTIAEYVCVIISVAIVSGCAYKVSCEADFDCKGNFTCENNPEEYWLEVRQGIEAGKTPTAEQKEVVECMENTHSDQP